MGFIEKGCLLCSLWLGEDAVKDRIISKAGEIHWKPSPRSNVPLEGASTPVLHTFAFQGGHMVS